MEQDDVIEVYQEQTGGGEEEMVRLIILPDQMALRVKPGTTIGQVKELYSTRSGVPTDAIKFSRKQSWAHTKVGQANWSAMADCPAVPEDGNREVKVGKVTKKTA